MMSGKKRVVVLGGTGGGQIAASVVQELAMDDPSWELAGLLNDAIEPGESFGSFPVIGRTDEAVEYARKGYMIHYALHNAKRGHQRIKRFLEMEIPEDQTPNIIHPSCQTRMLTSIGVGNLMAPMVNVSFGVTVGNYNHFYGNSFLGHDCSVRNFCSVANNASVGGEVVVDDGCHIGTNSSLREHITIGKYAIVGMGSVVLKNVEDRHIVVGNPAKVIGTVDQYD